MLLNYDFEVLTGQGFQGRLPLVTASLVSPQVELMEKIRPNKKWKYKGFEDLVKRCGREMKYAPLPEDIERGLPKNCYYNCLELLREHPELTYCEGYALTEDLPLPLAHAWLVDSNGNVIDPTWDDESAVYLGVPFNTQWFIDLLISRNREDCLSVFESNYLEDFSLLKKGISNDAIA